MVATPPIQRKHQTDQTCDAHKSQRPESRALTITPARSSSVREPSHEVYQATPSNPASTSRSALGAGPSASITSSGDWIDDKSSEELKAMLISNLQHKDRVNEQLIELMEGVAPPGTDRGFLESSRHFLKARIEKIRDILASRGSASFPGSLQPAQPSPGTARGRLTARSTRKPAQAAPVEPIILSSPSVSPVKSPLTHKGKSSEAGRSHAGSRRPLLQHDQGAQVDDEIAPAQSQRREDVRRAPSVQVMRGKSSPVNIPPRPVEDEEFADLDAILLDADEEDEALMAEIQGAPPISMRSPHGGHDQIRDSQPQFVPPDAPGSDAEAGPALGNAKSPVTFRANLRKHTDSDGAASSMSGSAHGSSGRQRVSLRDQMNYVWSRDVAKALRRTFKLQEFRNHQLEAINATLNGEDVFCLMPTGGGKSLCYQLPALIDSGRTQGVTVVISPLLSLIHDQVRHLLDLTVPALMLTGDMHGPKRDFALSELFSKEPTTRLLYLTPEFVGRARQATDVFTSLYRKKLLARFVIDEAHCVSQWGHDFRPDYQTLGKLRTEFPGVPVMAMTATANHRVKADVVASLGIKGCKVLEQSFNRANLRYDVREKNQKTVIADIAKFIQSSHKNQCGIVYCLSRRACEDVAERLSREYGLQAQHYHAALSKQDRLAIQKSWQAGNFRIIVATIAFGMGIDKGDVRFVIHHTLPQSLEGYYQETGRAGRDGKSSTCVLYFSYKDTNIIKRMVEDGEGTEEQKEQQRANLRGVVQYCMNKSDCRRSQVLQYFGEIFPSESCHHTCDNCCNAANNHRQAELQNLTRQAQQATELVRDLTNNSRGGKGGFTMLHFVDVFRGSQNKAVRERGHHTHQWAGAGSTMNRGDVERLFQHLTIREVFDERSEVNAMGFANAYLELGPSAETLLQGKMTIELTVQRATAAVTSAGPTTKKRSVTASRGGPSLRDEDFEPDDEWDISNVDLSPSPEPMFRREPLQAPARGDRRGILTRAESFESMQIRRQSPASRTNGATVIALDDDDNAGRSRSARNLPNVVPRTTNGIDTGSDGLYRALVQIRNKIARDLGCNHASVFDDATLSRIASARPTCIREFVDIRCVGDDKYEAFGREFLDVCKKSTAHASTAAKTTSARPASTTVASASSRAEPIDLDRFYFDSSPAGRSGAASNGHQRSADHKRARPSDSNGMIDPASKMSRTKSVGNRPSVIAGMPLPGRR